MIREAISLQPVIKWFGSKRRQAEQIVALIDKNYDTYYESFCGGCSVLYYILNTCPQKFNNYICNDINKPLISIYNLIKENPSFLEKFYTNFWKELNKDSNIDRKRSYFYQIRSEFNHSKRPELLFCIMRTTTNGMPRYNLEGEFNNSFHLSRNGIKPLSLKKIIYDWSYLLNRYDVSFISKSFEDITPSKKDFLYLDPPYSKTKGMYFGTINYEILWEYLRNQKCDYFLSFDGISGSKNNLYDVPKDLYTEHRLIYSGKSSFKRIISQEDVGILESLYMRK